MQVWTAYRIVLSKRSRQDSILVVVLHFLDLVSRDLIELKVAKSCLLFFHLQGLYINGSKKKTERLQD